MASFSGALPGKTIFRYPGCYNAFIQWIKRGEQMLIISRCYGILIAMYFYDPKPPHFHAKYSAYEALFDFNGEIIEGEISK